MFDILISGLKIYAEQGVLENSALGISKTRIQALDTEKNLDSKKATTHLTFPSNYHLVPGFIDIHIHGANGKDVMDEDVTALETISQALALEGTTAFLGTTMTASPEQLDDVLSNMQAFKKTQSDPKGALLLGAHLEGPFIAGDKVNAQRIDYLLDPDIAYIKRWQKASGNHIKLITLAPELAGIEPLIRFLKQEGIVASMGHSNATYLETMSAIKAGCSHATHLFNAMRGIHQREPGIVTAALLSDQVSVELIVDGIHLHPAIVKLVLKNKPLDKLILVTDAIRAKCVGDGTYDLGGQLVEVKEGIARLANGTLAGSTLKMSDALRNMLTFTDCSLRDVIRFVSENPAKALNIFDQKGSIALQKEADLVVLDEKFNVVLTICQGKIVYQK